MRELLRKGKRAAEVQADRWRLRRVYTRPRAALEPEQHLREAAGWLTRAQDHGEDRGVAYGTRFGHGYLASYPETTGYIIPTFLALADAWSDAGYERRAVEMGDWEIALQMDSGAVMGGRADAPTPTPAVFNTGQVLLGWLALHERLGEERFLRAAERAARWLVEGQEPDGNWLKGKSRFTRAGTGLYNVRVAWALGWYGRHTGDADAVRAAERNARYTLHRQSDNGWFADCCLTDPARPLLHTLAYTFRGLLELGLVLERDDLVDAAERAARAVRDRMAPDGYLPGRFRDDWRGAVRWSCMTGTAQTSIVWSRLARLRGDASWNKAARTANAWLMARHDVTSSDPAIRGGVPGSWPVWGAYGRFLVLNWATKFFVDALLLQRGNGS